MFKIKDSYQKECTAL